MVKILKAFPRLPYHAHSLALHLALLQALYLTTHALHEAGPCLEHCTSSLLYLLLPMGFFSPISLFGRIISVTIAVTCASPGSPSPPLSPISFPSFMVKVYLLLSRLLILK